MEALLANALDWIAAHESMLSGTVAIVVLASLVGTGVRVLMRGAA